MVLICSICKNTWIINISTFNFCDMFLLPLYLTPNNLFMKYFGSILEFTNERNKDIMRVYKQKLHEADFIVMSEIFKLVAESPAKRFYVSEERATVVVAAMEAKKPLRNMRQNRREMFQEIYRRYCELRKTQPQKTIYQLVAQVVNQPAPKFYMTPRTMGELI